MTEPTPRPARVSADDVRLGNDPESIRKDFAEKLFLMQAKFPGVATLVDYYMALAYLVRDRLLQRYVHSASTYLSRDSRTVAYLSAEYLMGPQLANAMLSLGITDAVREAMRRLDLDLEVLIEQEEEPGLGNGGLGRLAACFMDSLATLEFPAIGYGIRYEFGIFDQQIHNGWQVEATDRWLRYGNPWEVARLQIEFTVGLGGRTEHYTDAKGRHRARWHPERFVKGVPSDLPVVGLGTQNTNFLRLWSAHAVESFDLEAFNRADYWRAVGDKVHSENITKILYPNDESLAGKQLRLEQEYFFVSCSLQDMMRILAQRNMPPSAFADKYVVQLNDTHPSLAVAELMRLFIDEHGMEWEAAWSVVRRAVAYTNHTLLPEALETWPLPLFQKVLPRHAEIIFELNHRFLQEVRSRFPGDEDRVRRMSLIDESGERRIRMAHLATLGSRKVNGVAALHSRLLTQTVLKDFAELWPERFTNVTNGVTPRRFLGLANPRLSALITEAIGPGWLTRLERLKELEPLADDAEFRRKFREVKQANKRDLCVWLKTHHGVEVDPSTLFDIQVKRIHEYKRQHLTLLEVLWQWHQIRRGKGAAIRRTVVLGGKAAPGYRAAKLLIKLANALSAALERDESARKSLKIVFVPDFNVTVAQRLYPAADLSEQISTAGFEASGTGNMKFALNGALTIGTLDGANVEIREHVGAENFFLFGLTAEEVTEKKRNGYSPGAILAADPELAEILEELRRGALTPEEPHVFEPLVRTLTEQDPFLVLADFRAYLEAHGRVVEAWKDQEQWSRKAVLNVARMGYFSSDRSIREYAEKVWNMRPERVGHP
jgi:glycogen phosphorylase